MASVQRGYRFAIVPEWIIFHPDLNPTAVRVFAALDRYADSATRETHVSVPVLAKRLSCSEDVVRRARNALEKVGAIVVTARHDSEGRQTSSLIELAGDEPQNPGGPTAKSRGTSPAKSRTTSPAKSRPNRESDDREPDELDLSDAAAPGAEEPERLTAGQVAHRIQRGYWDWVKEQTGRYPIAMRVPAFKAIITPFLEAGIDGPPIKAAVVAIYQRGETLTKAGLERELDGRGHRRSSARETPRQTLRFDEHGNRIRESSPA